MGTAGPCNQLSPCMQVYWLVLQQKAQYPKGDASDGEGRMRYEEFLAEAQKGVNSKCLVVEASSSSKDKSKEREEKKKRKKSKDEG